MAGPVCVGPAVANAIARCSHVLCTGVAVARTQDVNTKQFNEDELRTRAITGLSDGAAAFAMVSVAVCVVMELSTAVAGTVCEVVLGHRHGWPPCECGSENEDEYEIWLDRAFVVSVICGGYRSAGTHIL